MAGNNRSVINLSDCELPNNVSDIMALADKYNYTYNLNNHTASSFHKNEEHFFKFNSISNSESIHECLLNCFDKNAKWKTHKNIGLTIFENKIKETNNFF